MANTILSVRDLRVNFSLRGKTLTAVRGASLDLYENETLAIVGESGSGKSVLTKTLIGMTDKTVRSSAAASTSRAPGSTALQKRTGSPFAASASPWCFRTR